MLGTDLFAHAAFDAVGGIAAVELSLIHILRAGIYLFVIMEWISALGYRMFPLSTSGYAGTFQDVTHPIDSSTTSAVTIRCVTS